MSLLESSEWGGGGKSTKKNLRSDWREKDKDENRKNQSRHFHTQEINLSWTLVYLLSERHDVNFISCISKSNEAMTPGEKNNL